jgi:hydroxypyruvate reductase
VKPEQFLTRTLRSHPRGESIARILAAALDAVEPGEAVRRYLSIVNGTLSLAGNPIEVKGKVLVLGIGKAAAAMTLAVVDLLGPRLRAGLVVTKRKPEKPIPGVEIIEGGHPVPDRRSLDAGKRVEEFVGSLGVDDLLISLISGGGSALVTSPVDGVSLGDMQSLTTSMLGCGARINEMNILRRQLDKLKGGGLSRMAAPARIVSLILSDVVGNSLETIASGPTAPDPTTAEDALAVLERYKLVKYTAPSIVDALKQRKKSHLDDKNLFSRIHNVVIGSNLTAAQAALKQAADEGFHPYLLRTDLQGEAREAARDLSIQLRWAWKMGDPAPRPACIVAGGETTVTVQGNGRGGRNTELALASVSELADFPAVMLVTLATDGEDGDTDSAGAVVTGETWRQGIAFDMNATEFLNRNDSYSFFDRLDDLLRPGPTGTNVNDLSFLFTF